MKRSIPPTLLLGGKLLRRRVRRLAQMLRYQRLSLQNVPILFANSFPKSGTHLLTQILHGFTRLGPAVESGLPAIVTFIGESGRARGVDEISRDLQRLLAGDIAYGHLHDYPETVKLLCSQNFATYLILRDPRDVVISHVHYVTDLEPSHIHHRYYTHELSNFEERLRTSILGQPDRDIPFPDIRTRLDPYLGWLEKPEILYLRYEDYSLDQEYFLKEILDHAVQRGFPLVVRRQDALQVLAESVRPERSPTFREGKTGNWRTQFSPENKRLFKEVTGDLLIKLGYEVDHDW